jgi:hypothetical protein
MSGKPIMLPMRHLHQHRARHRAGRADRSCWSSPKAPCWSSG